MFDWIVPFLHYIEHCCLNQINILQLSLALLIVTNRWHCNYTDFHCLEAGCEHSISPDTVLLDVYLPTSWKNLMALFWTALMHKYVLSPPYSSSIRYDWPNHAIIQVSKTSYGIPPSLLHLAINRPRALLALCAASFAVLLKSKNSFKTSPMYLYLSIIWRFNWPHVNLKVVLENDLGLKCITLLFVALTDMLLDTHQLLRISSISCISFSLSANRTMSSA